MPQVTKSVYKRLVVNLGYDFITKCALHTAVPGVQIEILTMPTPPEMEAENEVQRNANTQIAKSLGVALPHIFSFCLYEIRFTGEERLVKETMSRFELLTHRWCTCHREA